MIHVAAPPVWWTIISSAPFVFPRQAARVFSMPSLPLGRTRNAFFSVYFPDFDGPRDLIWWHLLMRPTRLPRSFCASSARSAFVASPPFLWYPMMLACLLQAPPFFVVLSHRFGMWASLLGRGTLFRTLVGRPLSPLPIFLKRVVSSFGFSFVRA